MTTLVNMNWLRRNLLVAATFFALASACSAAGKPNMAYFLADNLGYGVLGYWCALELT